MQNRDQWYCETCNVRVSGRAQYELHLQGDLHRKRSKGETGTMYRCELCDVTLSGDNCRLLHEQGRQHQQRLAQWEAQHKVPSFPPPSDSCGTAASAPPLAFGGGNDAGCDPLPSHRSNVTVSDGGSTLSSASKRARDESDNKGMNEVVERITGIIDSLEGGLFKTAPQIKITVASSNRPNGRASMVLNVEDDDEEEDDEEDAVSAEENNYRKVVDRLRKFIASLENRLFGSAPRINCDIVASCKKGLRPKCTIVSRDEDAE